MKEDSAEDLVVLGSGEFAQALMEHDLIDHYDLVDRADRPGGREALFP
jgi:hypothetical protein